MAEFTRELTEEYWRPAPIPGSTLQTNGLRSPASAEFCAICGTRYAPGTRFCHLCGLSSEAEAQRAKRSVVTEWLDLTGIRERTGLSTISLGLVLLAVLFVLAAAMTGLVYNTATIAEWQAVQIWRIEWLLATVAALLAAMLFKKL
jgi:hypothetical protein